MSEYITPHLAFGPTHLKASHSPQRHAILIDRILWHRPPLHRLRKAIPLLFTRLALIISSIPTLLAILLAPSRHASNLGHDVFAQGLLDDASLDLRPRDEAVVVLDDKVEELQLQDTADGHESGSDDALLYDCPAGLVLDVHARTIDLDEVCRAVVGGAEGASLYGWRVWYLGELVNGPFPRLAEAHRVGCHAAEVDCMQVAGYDRCWEL